MLRVHAHTHLILLAPGSQRRDSYSHFLPGTALHQDCLDRRYSTPGARIRYMTQRSEALSSQLRTTNLRLYEHLLCR